MKIQGLSVTHLRNDAHFQFHTEFRDLVVKETPAALKITTQFSKYLTLYAREDEALKKISKSALTQRIHDADKRRDETFSAMFEIVKGMCKHFNPAIREAALRIQVILDTYGNVATKPMNEQTSAVYNLLF